MSRNGEPALVPVGHYHGVLHHAGPVRTVRLGLRALPLDEAEQTAWLLAHEAVEEAAGQRLRTADELVAAGAAPTAVARLRQDGLLVEVPDGPEEQAAWVERFRLVPLVPGLGNKVVVAGAAPESSQAAWFWVGLPKKLPFCPPALAGGWVALHSLGYDLWWSSGASGSLAEACGWQVAAEPEPGPVHPEWIDLDRLDYPTAVDQALRIVAPLVTSWAAALQPAALAPLVPVGQPTGSVLPAVEPVDAAALDPEEVLAVPWRPEKPDGPTRSVPRWRLDPGHPGAAGWLFAVGHDGGLLHRVADGVLVGRRVRIGAEDLLLSPAEGRLWELTLGADGMRLWNRSAVAAAAVAEGVPEAGRCLDELIERGLIVEVHPGTAQARAFAQRYRLRPSLHGLGDEPDGGLYQVGVPGRGSLHGYGRELMLLWATAGEGWQTLWSAVEAICAQTRDLAVRARWETSDPEEFLTRWVFDAIRRLQGHRTAYVDLAPDQAL